VCGLVVYLGRNVLFCLRRYSCTIDQLLACRSKYVVHSFVSGSYTEAQLSTANILSECLMLRDNLLSLSVDFFASGYSRLCFTSVCGVAFILFFILLLLPAGPLSGNNPGQVVHTHVPLSPSSMIWYQPNRWEGNGSIWERCGLPPI